RRRTFIFVIFAVFLLLPQLALASPGRNTDANPERFQETVSISIMSRVQSSEVGPPPDDWFLKQAILDELNIDVDFQFVTLDDEYDRTLQTRAAANDLPDLFQISPISVPILGEQGLLGDWTPIIEQMPTFNAAKGVDELKSIGLVDDQILALTTRNPSPFKGIVVVRQDWLDNLGLEVPTTLDEYLAVMKAFTEQDPDGNGRNDTYGWTGSVNSDGIIAGFQPILGTFGALGDWQLQDNTLTPMATTDGRREALTFINKMMQQGVVDPDWSSQGGEDQRLKWKQGTIGLMVEDWCATFCLQGYGEFVAANPTGVLTIIDPPLGPTGLSSTNIFNQVGMQLGMSQQAASDGRAEAIARFLDWMEGPGYERIAFGQPDLDYTKTADGLITQKIEPEHLIQRQLCGWAYNGTEPELRARYGSVTEYPNGETIDVYAALERSQLLAKTDITQFGALPPYPAEISADLQRTDNQGEFNFVSGARPIAEWDAYIQSLNDIGIQTWVDAATERAREVGLVT
ncbi:MAG: extracellular solute-binding protein, partial [Thermomicrobiales bacterium]